MPKKTHTFKEILYLKLSCFVSFVKRIMLVYRGATAFTVAWAIELQKCVGLLEPFTNYVTRRYFLFEPIDVRYFLFSTNVGVPRRVEVEMIPDQTS